MKKLKRILIVAGVSLSIITMNLPSGKEYGWADLARTYTGIGAICCLFGLVLCYQDEALKERH